MFLLFRAPLELESTFYLEAEVEEDIVMIAFAKRKDKIMIALPCKDFQCIFTLLGFCSMTFAD